MKNIFVLIFLCVFFIATSTFAETKFFPAKKNPVPDVYIVVLKEGVAKHHKALASEGPSVSKIANELTTIHEGKVNSIWDYNLQAFVAQMNEEIAKAMSEDPRVSKIIQDRFIIPGTSTTTTAYCRKTDTSFENPHVEFPSSPQLIDCEDPFFHLEHLLNREDCNDNWGLDRIDSGETFDTWYNWSASASGNGVHVYVVDTGIYPGHNEFENESGNSRVSGEINFFDNSDTKENTVWSHGTHVAGIIGGKTYGVAKNSLLHPYKISHNGSTRTAGIINALFEIANYHHINYPQQPAVVNMSLNTQWNTNPYFSIWEWCGLDDPNCNGIHPLVKDAVQAVLDKGILVIESAGNGGNDALPYVVQNSGVLVVGATDASNKRMSVEVSGSYDEFRSNYGSRVDIWAPGENILSAWRPLSSGETDLANACRLSGTSMAAPHATGVAALYLEKYPYAKPSEVKCALIKGATIPSSLIDPDPNNPNLPRSPNRLLAIPLTRFFPITLNAFPGTINTRTPLFQWNDSVGSTKYHLKVKDSAGYIVQQEDLTPDFACGNSASCKVTLAPLAPGSYTWWIEADYDCGTIESDHKEFTITLPQAEIIGTWSSGFWYYNVANSTWTKMYSSIPSGPMAAIAAGDVTGDGKADVISSWDSGLWHQNGATLGWTKVYDTPPSRIAAGDITGDGRAEIIGVWSSGIWYWNPATSGWTQMCNSTPPGPIAAGEVTGDGKADIISVWPSGLWYQNGATLGWTNISNIAHDRVAAGDITGDGRDEIIATWGLGYSGILYYNLVPGYWTYMYPYTPSGPIAAGDVTGDGIADLIFCQDGGLWYQDGATYAWKQVSTTAPSLVTAGDITGD